MNVTLGVVTNPWHGNGGAITDCSCQVTAWRRRCRYWNNRTINGPANDSVMENWHVVCSYKLVAHNPLPAPHQFSAHVYCGQMVAHLSYCWALVKAPKSCHITPILHSLHWLKITKRIEYKLLSFTYKVLPPILHICITPSLFNLLAALTLHLLLPSLDHQHRPHCVL